MNLTAMRQMYGEYTYPEPSELISAVTQIEDRVEAVLSKHLITVRGVKGLIIEQARFDLANAALTRADGYPRKVRSFIDLTRAELLYLVWWINQADVAAELTVAGWIPVPTKGRLERLAGEVSLSRQALKVIRERWAYAT